MKKLLLLSLILLSSNNLLFTAEGDDSGRRSALSADEPAAKRQANCSEVASPVSAQPIKVETFLRTIKTTTPDGKTFFTCIEDGCGKQFSDHRNASRHHRNFHLDGGSDAKKLTCSGCGMKTIRKDSFKRHLKTCKKTHGQKLLGISENQDAKSPDEDWDINIE